MTPLDRIEASLLALAERDIDIRHSLFDRFFAEFPHRQPLFYAPDAASRRMTDETLRLLHGIAAGEGWPEHLVNELVSTHLNYGALTDQEYARFVDLTLLTIADALGKEWDSVTADAWTEAARHLKRLIVSAQAGWRATLAAS